MVIHGNQVVIINVVAAVLSASPAKLRHQNPASHKSKVRLSVSAFSRRMVRGSPAFLEVSLAVDDRGELQTSRLQEVPGAFNWYADYWSDCFKDWKGCPAKFKYREVTCREAYSGTTSEGANCPEDERPQAYQKCECGPHGAEVCNSSIPNVRCPEEVDFETDRKRYFKFVDVGCFEHKALNVSQLNMQDFMCQSWNGRGACRDGLPFYNKIGSGMTAQSCSKFCIEVGLDVSGWFHEGVCRCGATFLSKNLWRDSPRTPKLAFVPYQLKTSSKPLCPLKVQRFNGYFERGGVSKEFQTMNEGDEIYLESIIAGHTVDELTLEDGDEQLGNSFQDMGTL